MGGRLELRDLFMRYEAAPIVDHVSLEIRSGELLALVGPSGSGKTTLLKLIAGLLRPEAGSIWLDGRDITDVPPAERRVGLVFQSLALFPHLTVADNIGYGLEAKRVPKAEREKRIAELLERLHLDGLEDRHPDQLSGGQQQRVAVARALAPEPEVLLFDEPLASVDARLRDELRWEIRTLHRESGTTGIYVTHDHGEAAFLGDRLAIMAEGRVHQVGPPSEVEAHPQSAYVAWFVGYNVLGPLGASAPRLPKPGGGGQFLVVAPPEIELTPSGSREGVLLGIRQTPEGVRAALNTPQGRLEVALANEEASRWAAKIGSRVRFGFRHALELPE